MSKVDCNAPTLPSLPAAKLAHAQTHAQKQERHDTQPEMQAVISQRFRTESVRTPTLPSLTFADIKEAMEKLKAAEERELIKQVIATSKAKRTYDFHLDVAPRSSRNRPIIKREE